MPQKFFEFADNTRNVIKKSMKNWKLELTSGGETLGEVKTNRGIFEGDSLSPILFIIIFTPLAILLRDMKAGCMLRDCRGKISHLLLNDDLKLYGKMIQELDSLVQTVGIFSSSLGMQFGFLKCEILEMKRAKVVQGEEIELQNGETIISLEDDRDTSIWVCYNCNDNEGILLKD